MERIKRFDFNDLYLFTQDDYLKTPDIIDEIMTDIYLTHEKLDSYFSYRGAVTEVNKINSMFFYTEFIDARLYVLTNKQGKPISMAICSHEDAGENSWHIEYLCTNKHYAGEGYGEFLLTEVAKDLHNSGARYMTCIVNKKNIKSLSMIASFAKNANVKQFRDDLFGGRCRFEYDLSNVNIEKPGKKDEETL